MRNDAGQGKRCGTGCKLRRMSSTADGYLLLDSLELPTDLQRQALTIFAELLLADDYDTLLAIGREQVDGHGEQVRSGERPAQPRLLGV